MQMKAKVSVQTFLAGNGLIDLSIVRSQSVNELWPPRFVEARCINGFTVFFAFVLAVATVAGQRFGFPQTSQFGLASLTGDFGGPTAFGGQDLSGTLNAGVRDPRQNRGEW
ncbi:AGAP003060-PB-like protein [Anopheles sinensis]|uniref:AGAP003060-PB-like protein n=1 Tax=Anopheles sinensis TaxID=74873 RepID=A0A084WS73_ANOSI|nr:AGAP003060-PB-like protein [Anopheles sinensis]